MSITQLEESYSDSEMLIVDSCSHAHVDLVPLIVL